MEGDELFYYLNFFFLQLYTFFLFLKFFYSDFKRSKNKYPNINFIF